MGQKVIKSTFARVLRHVLQPNLFLHWPQGIDDEANMLVHVHTQFLDSLPNIVSVYRARKSFVP
jgi:hypothetical protein